MNWQPIETAPKNGTRVLLYRDDWQESVCVGYWDSTWADWSIVGGGTPCPGATHWADIPPLPNSVHDDAQFSLGQVWQTSRGHLWHVVEITPAGQAVLRQKGLSRRQYQRTPPRMWKLYQPNNNTEQQSESEP